MAALSEPLEILDMADGQTITLTITRWEEGEATIHPRYPGAPTESVINVLRVHVPPDVKATVPLYWDITSKTLIAGLKSYLGRPGWKKRKYTITAIGVRPTKRFTLTVE